MSEERTRYGGGDVSGHGEAHYEVACVIGGENETVHLLGVPEAVAGVREAIRSRDADLAAAYAVIRRYRAAPPWATPEELAVFRKAQEVE